MALFDHEERVRARLGVTAHGSVFSLYDQEENSAFSVTESTLETTLLKARKLEIVDEGRRADLGAGEQGHGLVLSDPNGDSSVGLLLSPGGGGLSIREAGGESVLLGVEEGFPFLSLYDGKGVPRAILRLEDGAPLLLLTDVEGRRRAKLGVLPGGEPALSLFDEDQVRPRTFLALSSLGLADKSGDIRLLLSAYDEPVLVISGEDERAHLELTAKEDFSLLRLHGEEGQTLLELVGGQDGSILRLRDHNGQVRIALNALSGGTRLFVYDTEGEVVWSRP